MAFYRENYCPQLNKSPLQDSIHVCNRGQIYTAAADILFIKRCYKSGAGVTARPGAQPCWLKGRVAQEKESPMSHVPELSEEPVVNHRTMPPMTWNGALIGPLETATHYLHLTAFPCDKCNGPVIVASLGTRHDHITQETDIRPVGAICIACGDRPEAILPSSVDKGFRPVEWPWAIRPVVQP